MSQLLITNTEDGSAYPFAIVTDEGTWAINPLFEQDDFAEWLIDQGTADLEMVQAEKLIHQYTGNCPGCGDPVVLLPDEDEPTRDIMNYECTNCGDSNSIELVEPEDESEEV